MRGRRRCLRDPSLRQDISHSNDDCQNGVCVCMTARASS